MIWAYEARLKVPLEKALQLIRQAAPRTVAIIIRPELGSPELLKFSRELTLKAFAQGAAVAHSAQLEWMRILAAEGNVSKAVEKVAPAGNECVIASDCELASSLREAIGIVGEVSPCAKSDEKFISDFYKIKEEALRDYSVIDIACEKIAVEAGG
jgi:tRNA threonylcarbamoyladenosine modification (KEOPS) complex Cgi121 subunit